MNPLQAILTKLLMKAAGGEPAFRRSNLDDDDYRHAPSIEQALNGEQKNFDWNYYESITSGYGSALFNSEYMLSLSTRVTKGMYILEPWIHSCIFAVQKQFQGPQLYLGLSGPNDKIVEIKKHPFLEYYNNASRKLESAAYFTANGITDLMLTGNAYWWNSPDKKMKRRIPSERIEPVIVNNQIIHYRIMNTIDLGLGVNGKQVVLAPEEVTHIKLPNPFSSHFGMPLIIAILLPVLIDKYGMEYVVGFFLRGGNTTGIIQTQSKDPGQLLRLAKTIMQAFGGRRNMHADKILPHGVEWKGSGNTFGDLRLIELMKANMNHFKAATGCTDVVLGIAQTSNRATAYAEMEMFWQMTILPLQKLWSAGVENSDLWQQFGLDSNYRLMWDNSSIPYLDDLDRRLDQDLKFKSVLTINERRERLGYKPLSTDYDKLESEISKQQNPFLLSAPTESMPQLPAATPEIEVITVDESLGKWKAEESKIQEPSKEERSIFQQEFDAWERIVLVHLEDKAKAVAEVESRRDRFSEMFTDRAMVPAMKAYDNQIQGAKKKAHLGMVTKETEKDRIARIEALRERALQVISGQVLAFEKTSFLGYSKTAMDRVYDIIEARLEAGDNLTDIASAVRQEFKQSYNMTDAYKGQAETIVRQEYNSAISIAQAQFGEDLKSVSEEMEKNWFTMGDQYVRDSCLECESIPIRGKSDEVIDKKWPNGLRYPREAGGEAKYVVGCRCTIQYTPVKWKD